MRVWIQVLVTAGLICGWSCANRALGCEVAGEAWRPDKPGQPYEALTSTQYFTNCEDCKASIEEAYKNYPRYYRNLHCVDCDCDQTGANGDSSAGDSSNQAAQAQGEADEKERQANLAKQQKFKEDKEDALSQLKGVAGDSEAGDQENAPEPVNGNTDGPQERAKRGAGRGLDQPASGAKPTPIKAPPASDPKLEVLQKLKKEIKQYQGDLAKKKKKIQELNTKITQLAVEQNEAAVREAESAPATPPPGEPEAKPSPVPKAGDSVAQKLDDLNALRQAAMADQADLEKKIGDSKKQVEEMSKPTPVS